MSEDSSEGAEEKVQEERSNVGADSGTQDADVGAQGSPDASNGEQDSKESVKEEEEVVSLRPRRVIPLSEPSNPAPTPPRTGSSSLPSPPRPPVPTPPPPSNPNKASSPSIEVVEEYEALSPSPSSVSEEDAPVPSIEALAKASEGSLNDTPVPPKESWVPAAAPALISSPANPVPPRMTVPGSASPPAADAESLLESGEAPSIEQNATAAISPDEGEDAVELEESDEVKTPRRAKQVSEPSIPPTDRKPPPPRRSTKPSLPKVKKPRSKAWWETLFGDDFSRAYRPMSTSQVEREVDFILGCFDISPGAVILDLACGQGEICVELSRRGYSVVGYDLSVYQLAMAGDNAQAAGQKINFLQGDMREMAFDEMFDAIICWDTSFGFFEEEKNLEVLGRIKKALKPKGELLLDVMNRDFVAREAPYTHWFEGDGCVCMDDMSMNWITNRMSVKRSIILDDGRSKELQYSTRLYNLSEVGSMLHDSGFRVAAVSGDVATRGAFFGPNSRRIIIQANKP